MDVKMLTNGSLQDLHRLIGEALAADDALPPGAPKGFGVREHSDWRVQADAFEAELENRNVTYTRIVWD